MEKVNILIPAYNAENTIRETLNSCIMQDYPRLEIIVSDNCSTDRTAEIASYYPQVKLYSLPVNIGGIENANYLLNLINGEYFVFLCADDYFTNPFVITEIVNVFKQNPNTGFVGRYYYQFLDGHKGAIRAFRSDNPFRNADNWSGLAFRSACLPLKLSHRIFLETADMVKQVLDKGWGYSIIKYDTIAVRSTSGQNGSQVKTCYLESPLKNWTTLIKDKETLTAFNSLVQIKNWGTYKALLREIYYFVKFRPLNLLRLDFWLFSLLTIFCPKKILKHLVSFYKHRIGRLLTKEINRWSQF